MCGRFRFTDDIAELRQIAKEVNEQLFGKSVKTGEIYPTDLAVVAVWEDDRLKYLPVRWGFPKYKGKGVIINARSETAAQKPMFREPLLNRRCVVPSTGFYEWKHKEGSSTKEKFLITEPGQEVMFMAGLISTFTKSDDGSKYDAFTVLTTAANESISPLHDRMPVILQRNEIETWLRDGEFMQTVLDRTGPVLEMTVVNSLKEAEYKQTSLFNN